MIIKIAQKLSSLFDKCKLSAAGKLLTLRYSTHLDLGLNINVFFFNLKISDDEDELPVGTDFLTLNASTSKNDGSADFSREIEETVEIKRREFSRF